MARLSTLSRSVAGKVVIVTGAASGMGRATAHLFGDEGAHVAVTDVSPVDAVLAEMKAAGHVVHGWSLDVADGADISAKVTDIAAHFGGIDILINNAGVSLRVPIDSQEYESKWFRAMDIMLTGQVRMIRAALPWLRKSQHPRIVNIASTEGLGATGENSPYASAKTGVIGLTRAMAVELGRENITVNCICPGPIRTGITERIPEEHKQKFARRRTALLRYGEPEEVAQMTLSMCLPAASYLTGQALAVDGGLMVRNA